MTVCHDGELFLNRSSRYVTRTRTSGFSLPVSVSVSVCHVSHFVFVHKLRLEESTILRMIKMVFWGLCASILVAVYGKYICVE